MLISTDEAAKRLGLCSRATIIKLVKNGTLRGVRIGHLWKIYAASVDEVLKE